MSTRRDFLKLIGITAAAVVMPAITKVEEPQAKGFNYFLGTEDDKWTNPNNWSRGVVPADGDDVCLVSDCFVDKDNVVCGVLSLEGNVCVTFNKHLTCMKEFNAGNNPIVIGDDGQRGPLMDFASKYHDSITIDLLNVDEPERIPTYLEGVRNFLRCKY